MNIGLYITMSETDGSGNIIKRGSEFKANSLVQGFSAILNALMTATSVTVPDTSNVSRAVSANASCFQATGATAGNTALGIVAGTGTNAVAVTDYALQTLIAQGTGSGQLEYSAQSFGTWTQSGGDAYSSHTRTLLNNSGGDITINELGYVVRGNSTTTHYFLIDRTLPTPYTVTNGSGVVIEYKWKVTV